MNKLNLVKMGITVFCFVGSFAALYNVYSDNTELRQRAEAIGCGEAQSCAKMLGEQRTPFAQTFTFQVETNKSETAIVKCERALILFGDYGCNKLN